MEEETPRKFSYPNVDQSIPGVRDAGRDLEKDLENKTDPSQLHGERPVIHILDALNQNQIADRDSRTIRTFQADIADAIKNDNISMIRVALAEKKRQERQGSYDDTIAQKKSNKTLIWVVLSAVALVIVAMIGVYFLIPKPQTPEQIVAEKKAEPLMYAEQFTQINIDGKTVDDLERLLRREKGTDIPLGSMKGIIFTTTSGSTTYPIIASDLFNIFNTRAPEGLKRSLEDKFMLGIYSFSPYDFFAIFKINSYDTAFASMLEWEPFIETDLGNVFITKKLVPLDRSTTTSRGLFSRTFVDKTIENKDVRVLVDTEGTPAMLYTFLDKQTLVMASSEKSLKEIMFRLTAGKIVR